MYNQRKKIFLRRCNIIIDKLPIALRDRLVRSQVDLSEDKLSEKLNGIVFKLAETTSEYEQAFQILHDEYVSTNIINAENSLMRVTKFHALPTSAVIIAKRNDEVIATVSVIIDTSMGLPIDQTANVEFLREKSLRIGEISSLAIKRSSGLRRGVILFPMLTFMFRYSKFYCGIEHFVVSVNPRVAPFYEAIFGFMKLKDKGREYSFVNVKRVYSMFLDLNKLNDKLAKVYRYSSAKKDVHNFLFKKDLTQYFHFPKREYYRAHDNYLTQQQMGYFFKDKSKCFEQLSVDEKAKLRIILHFDNLKSLVPLVDGKYDFAKLRKSRRHAVNCPTVLKGIGNSNMHKLLNSRVLTVSKGGFSLADADSHLIKGEEYTVRINVGPEKSTCLKAVVVSESCNSCRASLKIIDGETQQWEKFMTDMDQNTLSA